MARERGPYTTLFEFSPDALSLLARARASLGELWAIYYGRAPRLDELILENIEEQAKSAPA